MPILKVLLNDKGDVVGTMRPDAAVSGTGGPQHVTVVARSGQRLIEMDVDNSIASLAPAALHAAVKSKHARAGAAKGTKPAKTKRGRRR
jgi:hypothetical protein